jgi:hypothetical protein
LETPVGWIVDNKYSSDFEKRPCPAGGAEDEPVRRLELDGWRPFDIIGVPGMFKDVMVIIGNASSLSCSSANL